MTSQNLTKIPPANQNRRVAFMVWPHCVSVFRRDQSLNGHGVLMGRGLHLLAPPRVGGASV